MTRGLIVVALVGLGFGALGLRQQAAPRREEGQSGGNVGTWNDPPAGRPLGADEMGRLVLAARALGPALVHVGHPAGDAGTAFVISKRYRLLATNAHVAAIYEEFGGLLAVPNGLPHVYHVERVWVHPDDRLAHGAGVVIKGGADPVYSRQLGPDVAVLKLTADGPDLEAECRLADPADLEWLEGEAVGKLGFAGPLGRGRVTVAGQAFGVVTRVNPFAASWDISRRWRVVDASTPVQGGESGGPLFLADGRVIAVSAWGRYASHTDLKTPRRPIGTAAVRVEALHELLKVTGLAGLVGSHNERR